MRFRTGQTSWLLLVGWLMIPMMVMAAGGGANDWSVLRQAMLRAIMADVARHGAALGTDSLSVEVVDALSRTPRHLFVPARYRVHAYDNNPLPIGQGQTISQPTIVAVMTELMAIDPADTVLEVGTGSGYQAAVLAELAAHVHTIEIIPELARSAAKILQALEYENVTVHEGDGYAGLPDAAPFAAIMVTAAPPELPSALLDQLQPGGVLVAPVGPQGGTQWLTVWRKRDDGVCEQQVIMPVRFVPMVGGDAE